MYSIEFHQIPLAPFRELPAELWSESLFRAHEHAGAYAALCARDVTRVLTSGDFREEGFDAAAQVVTPDRAGAWERVVRLSSRARTPGLDAWEKAQLRDAILAEEPAVAPALELMDVAASGYPDFLRGTRDGESILFDPRHASLWERYFDNANPLYAPSNTMAVHAAEEATRGRSGLRVLEAGAGCGSGTEALLERLAARVASYTATDISPRFLRRARERIAALHSPAVERIVFRLLDLNSPPAGWPCAAASFDLIFAVNVLHSVRDLAAVLHALRDLLAPDGVLVLGECVRPARGRPIHAEFVFLLLADFRNPLLDPDLRPEPGFLDAPSWRASLARAGFSAVRFVPDLAAAVAAYPDHSLAAIVARP